MSRPLARPAATLLAAAFAIPVTLPAQAPALAPTREADPIVALADAERAFAREIAKVGIRAGFLAWFARDAVGFQPRLGNAWDQRYGNYLSIWSRRPEGWRVFIDVGADAPSPVAFAPGFVRMPAAAGRYVAPASPAQAAPADPVLPLPQAERKANTDGEFLRSFADEARYHRPGTLPLVGRTTIEADPAARKAGLTRASLAAAQARSADLGYTYGRYETLLAAGTAPAAGATPSGYYVRVWRRNASGTWQIVAQVDQPDGR